MKNTRKSILPVLSMILIALLLISGIYAYYRITRTNAQTAAYDSLTLETDRTKLVSEYGAEYRIEDAVASHTGDLQFEGTVNPWTVGTQNVTAVLSVKDRYGHTVTREWPLKVTVEDTQSPVISFREAGIVLPSGTEYDIQDNILSVQDPADGELIRAAVRAPGSYTVTSDLDTEVPGSYTVTVEAADRNGNTASAQYAVTVYNVVHEKFPYYIRINRALNTVTVYGMDDQGNYSIPVKAMVCSTGTATPLGTYQTMVKYRWRALYGGVYGQYATRIVDSILFHSVPYYSADPGDLEYEEYNKLGTAASMGCIRLCVRDVKWIYDNCPVGTTTEIYDDLEDPGPLGKPEPLTIDISSPNRGWDPTDPDPANPWNS